MSDFSTICFKLLFRPDFAAHAAALQRSSSLATDVVRLLAPTFQAAAVALQLPPERRSAQHRGWSWTDLSVMAVVLASTPLRSSLLAHLAADGPGIGGNALQLLQPACQILSTAPEGMPPGQTQLVNDCWAAVCCLFSTLRILRQQLRGGFWRYKRSQQASRLLLQMLSQLAPMLLWREQLSVEHGFAGAANSMLTSAFIALSLLQVLTDASGTASAAAGSASPMPVLLQLCAAASAVLRSLPTAVELAQRHQRQLPQLAAECGEIAIATVNSAAASMLFFSRLSRSETADATIRARLSTAAFSLHSVVCRAMHFCAGTMPSASLRLDVQRVAAMLLLAARRLDQAAPAEPSSTAALPLRCMAAAHCVALLSVAGTPGWHEAQTAGPAELSSVVTEALVVALAACPEMIAATRASPESPGMLSQLIISLLQASLDALHGT